MAAGEEQSVGELTHVAVGLGALVGVEGGRWTLRYVDYLTGGLLPQLPGWCS